MVVSGSNENKVAGPPAAIAGASQTAVLGVRSLKRRGVRAVMFDSNSANAGFHSVYGPARLCPDPDFAADDWVSFMIRLAGELGSRPALIASSDKYISAVSKHLAALQEHFIISPGIRLQASLAEKNTQYELAARHGMPMPVTQFANSIEDVRQFGARAVFPCLMKPMHFREWERLPKHHALYGKKIAIAANERQLLEHYESTASVTPEIILQEIIEGPDTAKRVYLSCYNADSERIAHAMFRELRCDPLGFGPATVSEPVVDPEADEVCDLFLRRIGYIGLCEIELKRDTRDGRVKLIEANPRLSGGGDAAPYAGVDLCWLHYQDLIGERVTPVGPRGNHFRHIVLRADGSAIPAYLRAGLLTWRDIVDTYRAPRAFYDLDRDDWRFSMKTMLIAARLLARGIISRQQRSP